MQQAQPQLLSLLEKSSNPIKSITLTLKIKGVYAPPEQWKVTDEANPNIFGYTIQCLGKTFTGGKIEPRKLTEKEIKQQQQLKNKKGAKKQAKEQEKIPHDQDPEAQKKKIEWESLTEQEKFYRTSQDAYKNYSLKFTDDSYQAEMKDLQLEKLEKAVNNGKIQIILTRKPQINEEEIAKLKKSKPKNLNLGELYAANYVGKINLESLSTPGSKNLVQRAKVVFQGDVSAQFTKIQTQKSYILVQLELSSSLLPEVKQIKPNVSELFPKFQHENNKINLHSKLKIQIVRAIKAISQQYSLCFSKDKQHTQDKKSISLGSISTLRLNQINKKKDQFLNEFVNNGKYALLRQRISLTIKSICIDKFRKQRVKKQISKQLIQKTLSQLNVYFHEQFLSTVDEFMSSQSQSVHQDLILGHENSKHNRKQILAPIINESQYEKQTRLATQYQIINQIQNAEKHYLNLIVMNNQLLKQLQNYVKFCLKYKKLDKAYSIYQIMIKKSSNSQYKLGLSIILLRRKRSNRVFNIITQLIKQSNQIDAKIIYNQLLSFMYQRDGDIKASQKYLQMAQKYYQIKMNPNLKLNPPINPYEDPKPKIPKPLHYTSQLTNEQSQEIRTNFINLLAQYQAYDLVEQFIKKLSNSSGKQLLMIEVNIYNQKYDEALQIVNNLIQKNNKNIQLLLIKADICYKALKMFQSQEIFLYLLKLKPNTSQTFSIYLRLGSTYLYRKSWEDALNVFEKAIELKPNSSLSWLGLGVANLKLNKIKQAQESLNLANIYNPLGEQCQQHLQEVRKIQKKQSQQNYGYLQEIAETS